MRLNFLRLELFSLLFLSLTIALLSPILINQFNSNSSEEIEQDKEMTEKQSKARSLYESGVQKSEEDKFEEALKDLDKALEYDPENIAVLPG